MKVFIIGMMIGSSISLYAQDSDLVFMLKSNDSLQSLQKKTVRIESANYASEIRAFFSALISFYQSYISTQDEDSCSFTKSCSSFSREAVGKYGSLAGLLMTADRLLRCHPLALKYRPVDLKSRLVVDLPVDNYYLKGSKYN